MNQLARAFQIHFIIGPPRKKWADYSPTILWPPTMKGPGYFKGPTILKGGRVGWVGVIEPPLPHII